MNLSKSLASFLTIFILTSFNIKLDSSIYLDGFQSCNFYISSRNCRSCVFGLEDLLSKFDRVDTLFVVYSKNNIGERNHLMYLASTVLKDKSPLDTIKLEYVGDLFSDEAYTEFDDKELNKLFSYTSPLLFTRNKDRLVVLK